MRVLTASNRILLYLKETETDCITTSGVRDQLLIKRITARHALDSLVFQGLLKRAGVEDSIGRPVIYKLTELGHKEANKLNNYLKAVAV